MGHIKENDDLSFLNGNDSNPTYYKENTNVTVGVPISGLILILLVCSIFLIIGVVILNIEGKNKKQCTEAVSTTVVRFERTGSLKTAASYPVFGFEYNNETYEIEHNLSTNYTKGLRVGDNVTIYINSDNPAQLYLSEDSSGMFFARFFIGISLFVIVVMMICAISRKREKVT